MWKIKVTSDFAKMGHLDMIVTSIPFSPKSGLEEIEVSFLPGLFLNGSDAQAASRKGSPPIVTTLI